MKVGFWYLCLVLVSLAGGLRAETVRVPVTADVSIMAHPRETRLNAGALSTIKLKSWQHIVLAQFPAERFRGRVVRGATLHLHWAGGDPTHSDYLRRVGVSTVASPWGEGTGQGEEVPGASSFLFAQLDQRPWAYPGSDLTAVIFGQGHTIYSSVPASRPDGDGWQTVAVDGRLLRAYVAGLSYGLALYDDLGTDWSISPEGRWSIRNMPNRVMHSREQSQFAPYLIVDLGERDTQPPSAPTDLALQDAEPDLGGPLLTWQAPADSLGYFVRYQPGESLNWGLASEVPRYLIPLASEPGSTERLPLGDLELTPGEPYTFAVWAVDAAGNLSPAATVTARLRTRQRMYRFQASPPAAPEAAPPGKYPVGPVRVWALEASEKVDAQGKPVGFRAERLGSASALWDGRQPGVRLRAARNEFVAFHLIVEGRAKRVAVEVGEWSGPGSVRPEVTLWREWYVQADGRYIPDPLVPLKGPFAIPDPEQQVPGQQVGALLVDLYVPHRAQPGSYRVPLRVSADGRSKDLQLFLQVLPLELPDELTFRVELNSYGTPGGEAELNDHRLAHRYRTTLNNLPYSQSGHVSAGSAPKLVDGRLDWTEWDRRFGPLFDGSAFADLPRAGVPVGEFYLPLHENWPGDIRRAWTGGYWADEAFPEDYRQLFVQVSRQFAQHFRQKGWTRTQFQFYLNNKNTWKVQGSRTGSSPWVLDEPVDQKDFAALAYFARAFRQGVDEVEGDVDLVFRIDISRPQWQRSTLDGLVGLAVVGRRAFDRYNRLVRQRARKTGEMLFAYGSPNEVPQSNSRLVGWAVGSWSKGADGILPWQTIGRDASWEEADRLAVLYPAKKRFGYEGSYPSLRLVAFRRGQQDVEYINLLRTAAGVPRDALARALVVALGLADEKAVLGAHFDFGGVDFSGLTASDFTRLRRLLQRELLALPSRPESAE